MSALASVEEREPPVSSGNRGGSLRQVPRSGRRGSPD